MSTENVPETSDTSFARYLEVPGRPEFEIRLNVGGLPQSLGETGTQLFIIDRMLSKLEARRKVLKQHGVNQITEGKENVIGEIKRDGVRYLGYERNDVSWSKACNAIIEELVPRTKYEDAQIIINGFTKSTVITKLEPDTTDPKVDG